MEEIFEIIEVFNYGLLIIALGLNIYVVRTFGRGMLNVVFASLGFSIFFLIAYFVFHMLAGHTAFYAYTEETTDIWIHMIVYLSMISIIWGGYRIKSIVLSGDVEAMTGFGRKDTAFFSILTLILFFIFTISPALDGLIASHPTLVEIIDNWGLHHFTVFVLGALSAWYLMFIKGNWGLLSKSISALIGFLFLIGMQHFWESFTESWKIIEPSESIIEGVELLFVVPALILLCVAQWRIVKFIKG